MFKYSALVKVVQFRFLLSAILTRVLEFVNTFGSDNVETNSWLLEDSWGKPVSVLTRGVA